MAINVYTPGCHLLCHDDVIGSRRVSYILYLTDPDTPWKAEWGGALRLYPTLEQTSGDGKVHKIPSPDHEVSIPPNFNQLSFFAVQPGQSFHDVEEVYACKGENQVRVRTAISGWYHIPQEGEEGYIEGEGNLTDNSSLRQLLSNSDEFDLPKTAYQTPIVANQSSFTSNDDQKTPALPSQQEEVLLSEDDLNFLLKYISPTYLTPDTLESVCEAFTSQWSLTLETFLTDKFSQSLRDYVSIQESQVLPIASPEIETATPWTVARPPHKHRFLYQQTRETRPTDPRSQSPLQDLLENLFPSLPFYKWLRLATGQTVTSHNLIARRFRRGKDYTLATGYEDEESRLEITLAVTPTSGWEPDLGVEEDGDNEVVAEKEEVEELAVVAAEVEPTADSEVSAVSKPVNERERTEEVDAGKRNEDSTGGNNVDEDKPIKPAEIIAKADEPVVEGDVAEIGEQPKDDEHHVINDHGRDVGDVGRDIAKSDVAGKGVEVGGELAEISDDAPASNVGGYLAYIAGDDVDDGNPDGTAGDDSKAHKKSTLDPAVYQPSGPGDDGMLFSMPAGWNKLAIVLRDQGVFRFVKYISEQAKGDRWDVCGEYSVVNQDVEEEGDEAQTKADQIDYSDDTTEKMSETSSDDD